MSAREQRTINAMGSQNYEGMVDPSHQKLKQMPGENKMRYQGRIADHRFSAGPQLLIHKRQVAENSQQQLIQQQLLMVNQIMAPTSSFREQRVQMWKLLTELSIHKKQQRGTEFLNKTLHAYFKEEGIEHQTSTPRTPKQNGVVERQNRTLVESCSTMLSAS
ncbi:retrovirus-related pol polyprotein from transposon TNT 1-94 [Tanacetum coccineum]